MCQAKEIWSNATQHGQRFETVLCKPIRANRHTREDPVHGTSDILDMAFITPGLSFRDISFSVTDDHMGSDHFPIQISLDKPLKRNTSLTEPRFQFDKTNDDLLHNTLKDSLTNIDTNRRQTGGTCSHLM